MNFLLSFLFLAFVGTVGVYYGVQPLWQSLGWYIPPAKPTLVENAPPPANTFIRPDEHRVQPAKPNSLIGATPATKPAPLVPQEPDKPDMPGSPAAPANIAADVPDADLPSPSDSAEPAAEPGKPLPPVSPGSKTWGMTITCAAYYSVSGANRGQLPGGTIMDIEDTRTSVGRGEMSLGRVERANEMIGPYLVANSDLVRFSLARSEMPADAVANLKRYYELKGQLQQRLAELKQQALKNSPNPHAVAYAEAIQKYREFGSREKRLVAQRDAASGAARMRYADTLREMIPEGKRLERAIEENKARYNEWKAANPNAVSPDLAADDAQAQDLRRQIAKLEPQVKNFVR